MRTATKKVIAGAAVIASVLTLVAGVTQGVPAATVLSRTVLATVGFGFAAFVGGVIYEKLWLK